MKSDCFINLFQMSYNTIDYLKLELIIKHNIYSYTTINNLYIKLVDDKFSNKPKHIKLITNTISYLRDFYNYNPYSKNEFTIEYSFNNLNTNTIDLFKDIGINRISFTINYKVKVINLIKVINYLRIKDITLDINIPIGIFNNYKFKKLLNIIVINQVPHISIIYSSFISNSIIKTQYITIQNFLKSYNYYQYNENSYYKYKVAISSVISSGLYNRNLISFGLTSVSILNKNKYYNTHILYNYIYMLKYNILPYIKVIYSSHIMDIENSIINLLSTRRGIDMNILKFKNKLTFNINTKIDLLIQKNKLELNKGRLRIKSSELVNSSEILLSII